MTTAVDNQVFWYRNEEDGTIAIKQDADFIATAILVTGSPALVAWDALSMVSPSLRKQFTHGAGGTGGAGGVGGGDGIPLGAINAFGLTPFGVANVNYWYVLPVQEFLPRGTIIRALLEYIEEDVNAIAAQVALFGFKLFPPLEAP